VEHGGLSLLRGIVVSEDLLLMEENLFSLFGDDKPIMPAGAEPLHLSATFGLRPHLSVASGTEHRQQYLAIPAG
jgi:hypothetical protein